MLRVQLTHRYQPGMYLVRVAVTDGGVGTTSFRVRLPDRLEPSLVDAFFEWLDGYEHKNKPRLPGLR